MLKSQNALPSNRSFGFVFTAFFALVGAWSWWSGGGFAPWGFAIAAAVLVVALAVPRMLAPFNRAWMKLGELLHPVANFVVLGAIFLLIFVPVGLAMRLAGRDALRRRFDPAAKSYWIPRTPPGPDPSGLPNQF
jgi:hypothetical protein